MAEKRAHIVVSGRVQGVFFRAYTEDAASGLGVRGWVRNLQDGRVEIMAEGDEKALKDLIIWCHRGSPMAHVSDVDVEWGEATHEFDGFRVTH
jgi:acylphosphatase